MADRHDAREALVDALDEADTPVVGTTAVAERLDVSRPTATGLLEQSVAAGEARTGRVGGTRVWWLPISSTDSGAFTVPKTESKTPANTEPESEPESESQPDTLEDQTTDMSPDARKFDGLGESARERLRGGLPTRLKSEEDVDDMVAAVEAAVALVARRGTAGASDIQSALWDAHAGPYTNATGWYQGCIREGMQILASEGFVDDLQQPGGPGQPWRWG
jgi:hypothetical protein